MRVSLLFLVLFLGVFSANCQQKALYGKITDKYTGEELPSANVFINNSNATTTNLSGDYYISLAPGDYTVQFSFVGYVNQTKEFSISSSDVKLDIKLTSIELDEAEVYADIAIDRETPVAFTNIDAKTVEEELASQDLPMLLNSAPGVYATQQGGGDGDARITIRGFSQRNIAVMLDGVPVNDMENGAVFWSNWFGLDAIMQTTQVQRGLGVSKLAIPSVGGTINILTKGIEQDRSTRIKQEVASNGFLRTTFGHTSGRLKGNWGYTLAGSYKQGDGWVKGNWTQGFFYYAKVQKAVGNHVFTLNGFGAPQSHGQRRFKEGVHIYDREYASELGVDTSAFTAYGLNYNVHAGLLTRYDLDEEGNKINEKTENFNERQNYYHKPQFSFRHTWSSERIKFSLNNVAYLSIGNGGGTRIDGSTQTLPDGSQDFQHIYDQQTGFGYNPDEDIFGVGDPSIIPEYSNTEHAAYLGYLKSNVNNHFWYGLLSSFRYEPNEKLTYSGGIDLRNYEGEHYAEVYDLMGADYVVNKEVDDKNRDSFIFREGDKLDYHNDALVSWGGLFGQLEYKSDRLSGFFSASAANTSYKRVDYFLPRGVQVGDEYLTPSYGYEEDIDPLAPIRIDTMAADGTIYTVNSRGLEFQKTKAVRKAGFTVKFGGNYKLDDKNNVYINLGYLDRAPFFRNVFDFRNNLLVDIQNEKIRAFEFGYGFKQKSLSINLNGYWTDWENRPVVGGVEIPDPEDPEQTISANINGMNARHMGVELETAYAVSPKLTLEGIFFFYDNNEPVLEIGNNGEILGQMKRDFDAVGVHVGDAAQTQIGAMVRYQFKKGAYAKLRYTFFDRYFADFEPTSLRGENAGRESWMLPSYQLVELHAGYGIDLGKNYKLNIRGSILNLLNSVYISDASNNFTLANFNDYSILDENGVSTAQGFNAGSAGVFFGQGRRFNLSATLSF